MRQSALNKLRENRKTAEIEVTGQFNPTTDNDVEKMVLIYIRQLFKKGINDTTYTLETTWRDFSDTDISYIILGIESQYLLLMKYQNQS